MALVNHAKKEINAKIVYFGPAQSGKGTALSYIYSRIKPSLRGDLKSVPAGSDNLMFFDFSPFEAPLPNGYHFRLHIYTLTGMVTNPATWKMTLKGADGIMIMIDPDAERTAESRESIGNLRDFLAAYGVGLHETPAVLQLNQISREIFPEDAGQIAANLDLPTLPVCHTNAASGEGLLEALTTLSRQILDRVATGSEQPEADGTSAAPSLDTEMPEQPSQDVTTLESPIHREDRPKVVVLPQEVCSEGGIVRIPLKISHGDVLRTLVVTVRVDLE